MSASRGTRRRVLAALLGSAGALLLPGCTAAPPPESAATRSEQALRVATFNILFLDLTPRGAGGARGPEAWEARRPVLLAALRAIDADLIAFQEMESWTGAPQAGPPVQRAWLSARMPGHGIAAATDEAGRETGQPIFFRRDRLVLLAQGSVSLGTAPGLAGAFAGYADQITWARLRDRRNGATLSVLNLHLHFSDSLRRDSGAMLAAELAAEAIERGDRVIVLGDFNIPARSRPIRALTGVGLTHLPATGASFHLNSGLHLFGAIDHILHGPGLASPGGAQVLRGAHRGVWPSDHYPVWADLRPS